ncbi:hypothetical protein GIW54_16995 [Pseudomonas proteolytica]|uniref:DUF4354 family protein n=1 Tax=Pseudomonas proteolytica TaxID=219574 RepID=A0AAW5AB45_9PSED|nr:hypothetical protein [Pseudomonas proteolytica]MCF5059916.1 hypothetical protein [Pseudomonas proteolytica]MCF5102431.1 hypothetical protein [Pseudomonas proteolytica]
MADKNAGSGFPVDGGAGEKLAYLTKQISPADQGKAEKGQLNFSLNIQVDASGRQMAAGFSCCIS